MEDFTALAASLAAGVGDVRGCLVLSRDGLVLGAHPGEREVLVKPAWLRFAALGEPERGFVQFGAEVWCYARRGAYAAFVVAGSAVRPGLVIDQIEQALMAAEEARSKREGLRAAEPAAAPATAPPSRPRMPLHPEPKPVDEPPVAIRAETPTAALAAASEVFATPAAETEPFPAAQAEGPEPFPSTQPVEVPPVAEPTAAQNEQQVPDTEEPSEGSEEEVDRFQLAREFGQLLQADPGTADG